MAGKRIGYIRVSTVDQNPERQLEGVALDKKFTDYASGTTVNRPQLSLMIDYVREDDIIFVHSMDRLARNVKDLLGLVELFSGKGVEVHFVKENLIFNGKDSSLSKLLLMIIGSVAEFEHALIRERQREGIAIAKRAGKYQGRPSRFKHLEGKIRNEMETRKPKAQIAKELGLSRYTLYNYLKKIQVKNNLAIGVYKE